MSAEKSQRNTWLDFLKGIAILEVLFYHLGGGIQKFGYLGVDLFFVINGYLVTKSILKSQKTGRKFSYFGELFKRIMRLWPLVLISGAVCFLLGFFTMLPDDFENLSEGIVASDLFTQNILQAITTGNYWDIGQGFKPLMHTWYLGILVQFYVVYFFIVWLTSRVSKHFEKTLSIVLGVLSVLSLLCFLILGGTGRNFYLLHIRFFELAVGCLLPLFDLDGRLCKGRKYYWIAVPVLLALFLPNAAYIPQSLRLLLVVISSVVAVLYSGEAEDVQRCEANKGYHTFAGIGKASYSVFIWHQIIIAFYRYIYQASLRLPDHITILVLTALVSWISYVNLEGRLGVRISKNYRPALISSIAVCVILSGAAGIIYERAGVVRDVPELSVDKHHVQRGMNIAYCDRIYSYNRPFENNGKIKVLAIGSSFMRDWVNVLLESTYRNQLDIVYIPGDLLSEKDLDRIKAADYIFVNASWKVEGKIPLYLEDNMKEGACLYGIGDKRFGESNGNIYNRRFFKGYFDSTASFEDIVEMYEAEKAAWGKDRVVDFIEPVMAPCGKRVRVFTDDHKYISQDTSHLTQNGARYYARIMDLGAIFD